MLSSHCVWLKYIIYNNNPASVYAMDTRSKCDEYIRYGDRVNIRSEYKPKQYLCNDSNRSTNFLTTKKSQVYLENPEALKPELL